MLYGAGALAIGTRQQASNFAFPAYVASFELTNEDKSIEAKALLGGVKRTVASVISEAATTLTLTYEYSNWEVYQMIFDEVGTANDSIKVPMAYGDVLLDYTADANGNATNAILPMPEDSSGNATVYITETDDFEAPSGLTIGNIGSKPIGSATGASGINYSKAITLDVDYLGANATAQYTADLSSITTLGKNTDYTRLGRLIFTGILANTEFEMGTLGIIVPSITLAKTPSFKVDGEKPSLVLEYKCNVLPGYRMPYILYKKG